MESLVAIIPTDYPGKQWEFGPRSLELITIGGFLGAFHVLTPDHLSALSALSVAGGWRSFHHGVRWSAGHSISLTVITVLFIVFKGTLDLNYFGRYCDLAVGFFMIVIGLYGILSTTRSWKDKQKQKHKEEVVDQLESSRHGAAAESSSLLFMEHGHHDDLLPAHIPFLDMNDRATQRVVSLAMGLLHGVAGPGGILGVLPAVEMQHWQNSAIYLGSFIVASTVSMGSFAALWGEGTRRLGATAGETVELGIRVLSSSASVLVGVVWIAITVVTEF
jgi:hypothetical protein